MHGNSSCTTNTEHGEAAWITDAGDVFACTGLPGTPKERLQKLRLSGLAAIERLAENFTNNPEVVEAVEWVRNYVGTTPLPDDHVLIVSEGYAWWSAVENCSLGLSLLPYAEIRDPSWLIPYEVTDWLLKEVANLRTHAYLAYEG